MVEAGAAKMYSLLNLLIIGLIGVCQGGDFIVTHAPEYVTFRKEAGILQTSEIAKVISAASGFQLDQDLAWDGVEQGSLFRRPKANVLFTVDGIDGSKLSLNNVAKFPTKEDAVVETEDVTNYIHNTMSDKNPLVVDFSVDNTVFDIRTHHPKLFGSLPATFDKIRGVFLSGRSGFAPADLVSLNTTNEADLLFLGELHIIRQIVSTLKTNRASILSRGPDFFHMRVMGMRRLVEEHGLDSPQVRDATNLLNMIINEATSMFRELYGGHVLVQVTTMAAPERVQIRKGRSLMADADPTAAPTAQTLNLAPIYDSNYPVIFNIYLWTMIFWFIAIFFIGWGMWFIDPGRDSIIYRMTSQRMKKD